MLLDRKKIRRWAKWVALILVVFFLGGFLFLGIGYGGAGFNLSEIFDSGCSQGGPDDTQVVDSEQELLDKLAADPENAEIMLELAAYYKSLFDASQGTSTENAQNAAEYYRMALATDPSQKEVYLDLAKLYLTMGSYSEAAKILNEATAVDPENPDIYLYLGRAQKEAGMTGEAILAWQKYLELSPDNELAATVRSELNKMMAPSTTTTAAAATTTTVDSTSTTQ